MSFANITAPKIILALLILLLLVGVVILLVHLFQPKKPSFIDTMNAKKSIRLSLVIDLDRKLVEIYYVYATNNKSKTLNYDEFTYSFDSENLNKLTEWLQFIENNSEYGTYRRIELQMYDDKRQKRLYRCSLQNYIRESKKYFITVQDITDSNKMVKDYEKKLAMFDSETFFENVQNLLQVNLDNEFALMVTMSYKEHEAIAKDFDDDYVKLIDYEILNRLEASMEEDMTFCQSKAATFHVFLAKVLSLPKAKQKIKKLLQTCSGTIMVNKGNFDVTLFAGVFVGNSNSDPLNAMGKSELAFNQSLKRKFFNEKIKFYDEELSQLEEDKMSQIEMVKNIIDTSNFDVLSYPIVDIKSKQVEGYKVDTVLKGLPENYRNNFVVHAQEIGVRKKYFIQIFDKIVAMELNKPVFIIVPHGQVARFCEAYAAKEIYKNIQLNIIISFDNFEISDVNLVTLEKILKTNMEAHNMQFGIAIENFQMQYLNELIYSKLKYLVIIDKVIDSSFESTHFRIGLQTYQEIAKLYQFQLIGFDINNVYQYEKMFVLGAKYLSGPIFNEKISQNKVSNLAFLKQIQEIETNAQK